MLGGRMTLQISVKGEARQLPIQEVASWGWQQLAHIWKVRLVVGRHLVLLAAMQHRGGQHASGIMSGKLSCTCLT